MKKITQKNFEKIERNEEGIIVVPAFSDLTDIKSFPAYCSFGEGCAISGHEIIKLRSVDVIGEHNRRLYLWNTKDGFYCQAGCFFFLELNHPL